MSGLINKLSVPLFGLASVVGSGCYGEATPISPQEKESCVYCEPIDISPRTEPMVFTEPGTYKVIPGDVFKGPLGVDLRVEEIIPTDKDNDGSILGSYVDSKGNVDFSESFFENKGQIAYYSIKVLAGKEQGTLRLVDKASDLYENCIKLNETHGAEVLNCSLVSPTEALNGEVLAKSFEGYYGKINISKYPELANCGAMNLETSIGYTSNFLGLPPLLKGTSFIYVITENPPFSGTSLPTIAISYFKQGDSKLIDAEIKRCKQSFSEGKFTKGDHEITHLFTRKIYELFPMLFNEGLSNYVARRLNDLAIPWNEEGGFCFEKGLYGGGEFIPYVKYNQEISTLGFVYSGECFWSKLVSEYGSEVIKEVVGKLFMILNLNAPKPKDVETQKIIFEEALLSTGVDLSLFKQWGLGE
ncbi:MAG: hypothetical protein AB1668_07150 [Nanoarchaeota archaeon]